MTILSIFGLAVVRATAKYNYNAEWNVIRGQESVAKLTDEDGESFIQKQKAMLLFFYSRNCPHCTRVKPLFAGAGAKLAEQGSRVQLAVIELGIFPGVAKKYRIYKVPGIYLFRNGKMEEEYKGPQTTTEFVAYALKLKV